MTARRTTFLFTALGLLTAALFIADLAVGSVAVPLGDVWAALTGGSCDPATSDIILKIRLLKAITALFAGAALAAGGLEMQTLFRNPLAGPYVLGVSSGAGLGVALFLLGAPLLGVAGHSFVRSLGVAGAAWLGSALVLAIVSVRASVRWSKSSNTCRARRRSNRSSSGRWGRWATSRAATSP